MEDQNDMRPTGPLREIDLELEAQNFIEYIFENIGNDQINPLILLIISKIHEKRTKRINSIKIELTDAENLTIDFLSRVNSFKTED